MLRIFKIIFNCLVLAFIACILWLSLTMASGSKLPPLKNGDIVFQTFPDAQSPAVMFASHSIYTHVGMIKLTATGSVVIEAVAHVRELPLEHWIGQGLGRRVTVKRLRDLDPKTAQKIVQAAHKYYGRPYDPFFLPDDKAMYCSELVYDSYRDGANVTVGKMEQVRQLHIDNMFVRRIVQNRWQAHPLCSQGQSSNFTQCYDKILQQSLVTPASLARDSRMQTIYTNYGMLGE